MKELSKVRVRYAETDQMGVAHHSSYVAWLEVGRLDWFRGIGSSYQNFESQGFVLAVVNLELSYKRPALFDEWVIIKTKLVSASAVRVKFSYELYNEREELLTEAMTELACLSKDSLRPARIPSEFFDQFKSNQENSSS